MSAITIPIGMPLDEVEKHVILQTLEAYKTQKATYQALGISARTLRNKLALYAQQEMQGEEAES